MPTPVADQNLTAETEVCVEAKRSRDDIAAAIAAYRSAPRNDFDALRESLGTARWPTSARPVDYVGAFPYGSAPATAVEVRLEVTPHPWLAGHQFVHAVVATPSTPAPGDGGHVVFLVDNSPSMRTIATRGLPQRAHETAGAGGQFAPTSRIDIVREALLGVVGAFPPASTVAIAGYGGGHGIVLPPTLVAHTEAVTDAIRTLDAEEGWDASGGEDAFELAEELRQPCRANRVLVITDHNAHIELDPDATAARLMRRRGGITLSVAAVGMAGPVDGLEHLAAIGLGSTGYAFTVAELERTIRHILWQPPTAVGHLEVDVQFDPSTTAAVRELGNDLGALSDRTVAYDTVEHGLWEVAARPVASGDLVSVTWTASSQVPGEWSSEGRHVVRVEDVPRRWIDASPDAQVATTAALLADVIDHGFPRGRSWADLLDLAQQAARRGQPGDDLLPTIVQLVSALPPRPPAATLPTISPP